MKEELEEAELEFKGGVIEGIDLVYEPLGHGLYVWKMGDMRGISRIEPIIRYDDRGRAAKKPEGWRIKIGERHFRFKMKPLHVVKSFLTELPFRVPKVEILEKWSRGEVKVKDGGELFENVTFYIKVILDLEEEHNVITLALFIFQSWLRNMLSILFNIDIGGPFGSGKTTALEAIGEVCYHSLLGSPSAAALARMNEKYGLTWTLDEYDKSRSELSDHFIRSGYRLGSWVFRINPKTGREERFDPFGPKLISYHESLEEALKQRSLDHVKLTKSLDHRLPIINWARGSLSEGLFYDLFLWYMENAIALKRRIKEECAEFEEMISGAESARSAGFLSPLSQFLERRDISSLQKSGEDPQNSGTSGTSGTIEYQKSEENVDFEKIRAFREVFYEKLMKKLSPAERAFIQSLSDRPCELAFIAVLISRLLKIDVIDDLKEALEIKALEEEEEIGADLIVKETLAELAERGSIPQKEAYELAKKRVKEALGDPLSARTFKRILRDVGFREKKSIVKKREGRVLYFTDYIRARLPRRPEVQPLSYIVEGMCEFCGKRRLLVSYKYVEGIKYNICAECAENANS